ncbi:MAG: FtsX-like permease family protein [Desulfobacteraceae bacterium]|nr:MAG: FtsX-like permease family protein [Desulfobacteraceae bacterium]
MLFWTIIKVSFKSLQANKLRTFLAMLGIIIGVGAVISMLALGAGAKNQVMERITAMGTNLLVVSPGGDRRGGVRAGSRESLTIKDAQEIRDTIDGIAAISPLVRGREQVTYFNENVNTTITGTASTYLEIRNFEMEKGRGFTVMEEDHTSRVAILGANTAELLFKNQNPLGERIRIKNINFKVIGVLKEKGDQGWFNPDEIVVVPYPVAMKQLFGQPHLDEIDIKANTDADLTQVEEDVTALLRKRHRIMEDAENDFHVRNQAEIIDMASTFTRTFTILLGGIAGISLVVGGIGIMNIMLVTVTERTREIGVRKAIGAKDRDILRQFLLEAILISAIGGILGIVFGFTVAYAIKQFTEYQTVIETFSIMLALTVSASVGIFFGFYPAFRAAKLDPIAALRYE